jgi:hypothetical protein
MSILGYKESGIVLEELQGYNRRYSPKSNNPPESLRYKNDDPETEYRKKELNQDVLKRIEAAFTIMNDFYNNGFRRLPVTTRQAFILRVKGYCDRAMRERGSFSEKQASEIIKSNHKTIEKIFNS